MPETDTVSEIVTGERSKNGSGRSPAWKEWGIGMKDCIPKMRVHNKKKIKSVCTVLRIEVRGYIRDTESGHDYGHYIKEQIQCTKLFRKT